MLTKILQLAPAACVGLLAACTIVQEVEPVPPGTTTSVCIEENPDAWSEEFLPELRSQFEARGISTSTYLTERPSGCEHYVEYDVEWTWDMAVYLEKCDIRIYELNGEMIGHAHYDASGGGANMSKFGSTSAKLAVLMDELVGPASVVPGEGQTKQ